MGFEPFKKRIKDPSMTTMVRTQSLLKQNNGKNRDAIANEIGLSRDWVEQFAVDCKFDIDPEWLARKEAEFEAEEAKKEAEAEAKRKKRLEARKKERAETFDETKEAKLELEREKLQLRTEAKAEEARKVALAKAEAELEVERLKRDAERQAQREAALSATVEMTRERMRSFLSLAWNGNVTIDEILVLAGFPNIEEAPEDALDENRAETEDESPTTEDASRSTKDGPEE